MKQKQTEKGGAFSFHGIVAGTVRLRAGEHGLAELAVEDHPVAAILVLVGLAGVLSAGQADGDVVAHGQGGGLGGKLGRQVHGDAALAGEIGRIREADPEAALRSSFIVGFPGETEEDVEHLEEFLTAARLDWAGFSEARRSTLPRTRCGRSSGTPPNAAHLALDIGTEYAKALVFEYEEGGRATVTGAGRQRQGLAQIVAAHPFDAGQRAGLRFVERLQGVLVLGCHHENCRSLWGSDLSRKRIGKVGEAMDSMRILTKPEEIELSRANGSLNEFLARRLDQVALDESNVGSLIELMSGWMSGGVAATWLLGSVASLAMARHWSALIDRQSERLRSRYWRRS